MRPRNILLIDSDQSTRRQRVIMLLTHGYLVHAAERVEDVELPFVRPAPDLVLLRVEEPPDRSDSAYMLIRNAAPGQRIGFLVGDSHYLCQLFVDGVLVRPREELAGDLIQAVEAMFDAEFEVSAKRACVGS
jgi:AmiR/NasT family two-component response regulator